MSLQAPETLVLLLLAEQSEETERNVKVEVTPSRPRFNRTRATDKVSTELQFGELMYTGGTQCCVHTRSFSETGTCLLTREESSHRKSCCRFVNCFPSSPDLIAARSRSG